MKCSLLDRWLPESKGNYSQTGVSDDLDETVTNFRFAFKANDRGSDSSGDDDEQSFIRSVYLCQGSSGDDNDAALDYLLDVGFAPGREFPTTQKLRALKCLLSVASDESLREKTSKSADEIRSHLSSLHFVARLQALNLPYDSVSAFEAADKAALVESVLRSCGHLRQGIALAVDICVSASSGGSASSFRPSASLWTGLLDRMVTLSMLAEVRSVLEELNRRPHLWHFEAFRKAWKFVLLRPFETAASPPVGKAEV